MDLCTYLCQHSSSVCERKVYEVNHSLHSENGFFCEEIIEDIKKFLARSGH